MITVKKKKNKKKTRIYPYLFLFSLGLLILIYPLISQYYYRLDSSNIVNEFKDKSKILKSDDVIRRIELAKAYNLTLDPEKIYDPYSKKVKDGIAEYARMLEVQEMIGHVEIPKIGEDLPIYAGTTEAVLQKGAGHLEGTSLPIGGKSTHSVITAHRGLASAKLFRRLDELEVGDVFFIHNIEKTLAYKVDKILTVEPTNFEPVLVTSGDDYCTLLTCTPYIINSHRLLVRGHRIEYEEKTLTEEIINTNSFWGEYLYLIIVIVLLLILLIFFIILKRRKNKKNKKI